MNRIYIFSKIFKHLTHHRLHVGSTLFLVNPFLFISFVFIFYHTCSFLYALCTHDQNALPLFHFSNHQLRVSTCVRRSFSLALSFFNNPMCQLVHHLILACLYLQCSDSSLNSLNNGKKCRVIFELGFFS